jgi:hypothetical protein
MYQNIKALFCRRPYLTATVSGFLLTLLLIDTGILVLALSPILIGFVIGRNRVVRWHDVFRQFPAALGCFVLVVFFHVFIGTTFGILREFEPIFLAYLAVHVIPFLLVGEWIGWVLRPSRLRL